MKLLALDLSSKSSGIAIFEDGNLVRYECIAANDKDSLLRIEKMTDKIMDIYVKENIDEVIIEDVMPDDVAHNQNVFNVLHYLQASVVLGMHRINPSVKYTLFTASHWRSLCGIKTGRGIKRDILKLADMAFVKAKYNLDVNDDIADAICLGWAYLHPQKEFVTTKKAW